MLMLVMAALIYGGIFPVNRLAAEAGWPAMAFALMPAALGGVVLVGLGMITGVRISMAPRALFADVVIGGLVIGLPVGILVAAAGHLPAIHPDACAVSVADSDADHRGCHRVGTI